MARRRKRERGSRKRCERNTLLIGTEGNNKTETNYFSELTREYPNYYVKFAQGNNTDPIAVVNSVVDSLNEYEIDFQRGDLGFAVFDVDIYSNKKEQIETAIRIAKKNGIMVVLSNPSFEYWFLLHFVFTTKQFYSNKELELIL